MPLSIHENARQVALAHAVSRSGSSSFSSMAAPHRSTTAQIVEEAAEFLRFLDPPTGEQANAASIPGSAEALEALDRLAAGSPSSPQRGTFMWALQQMQSGHSVRRCIWTVGCVHLSGGVVEYNSGANYGFAIGNLMATDWEIVE